VLASSREPLGVSGEQVYRVPSLRIPDGSDPDPAASEAVRLFVARAQGHQAAFVLDEGNVGLVVSKWFDDWTAYRWHSSSQPPG
jgi:predicted ATPase